MKKRFPILMAFLALLLLPCCGGKDLANAPDGSAGPLIIYPDYKEVTIPANIAPLNFRYAMKGLRKARTSFILDDQIITVKGAEVVWPVGKWKRFLSGAAGKTIKVEAQAVVDGKPSPTAGTSL